jgi:hypothetical protein
VALGFSTELRTARANSIITVAGSLAIIRFYSGTRPASGGTATTLLASLTSTGVFGTASSGVLILTGFTTASAVAAGTVTWFRIVKADGTHVMDGSVGADITMTDTVLTISPTLSMVAATSMTITEGNA